MKKINILVTIVLFSILLAITYSTPSVGLTIFGKSNEENFSLFFEKNHLNKYKFRLLNNLLIPFPEIKPVLGERPLLLVLIEFSDIPHFPLHEEDYFTNLLFGERPSVKDYYNEVSYNKFTFINAGILGWYRSSHSITEKSRNGIVREAFRKAAKDMSFKFAEYDQNNDHILTTDELTIIVCTTGLSNEKPMGAYHNWRLIGGIIRTWDGIILNGEHNVVQEWNNWMVYAHELGHSLLLPDFYDYTDRSLGIGVYGLMGLGNLDGTNGHHFTAWSKIKLGWIDPTIITRDGSYIVNDSETNPEAYILKDSHSDKEYFIIENRYRGTTYDNMTSPLPDEGIMIYHVDENIPRWITPWIWFPWVNNMERHKMVDVECSDSFSSHFKDADDLDKNINTGDKNDLWDDSCYGFNSTSSPCNSRWYDGSSNNLGVYVLSKPAKQMTVYFSINGTIPTGDSYE